MFKGGRGLIIHLQQPPPPAKFCIFEPLEPDRFFRVLNDIGLLAHTTLDIPFSRSQGFSRSSSSGIFGTPTGKPHIGQKYCAHSD